MTFTSDDLPAPFGPIWPVTVPRSISSVASTIAFTPPKERLIWSHCKIESLTGITHAREGTMRYTSGVINCRHGYRRGTLPLRLRLRQETTWTNPQGRNERNTVNNPLH